LLLALQVLLDGSFYYSSMLAVVLNAFILWGCCSCWMLFAAGVTCYVHWWLREVAVIVYQLLVDLLRLTAGSSKQATLHRWALRSTLLDLLQ
jgi:hypothetical protein